MCSRLGSIKHYIRPGTTEYDPRIDKGFSSKLIISSLREDFREYTYEDSRYSARNLKREHH